MHQQMDLILVGSLSIGLPYENRPRDESTVHLLFCFFKKVSPVSLVLVLAYFATQSLLDQSSHPSGSDHKIIRLWDSTERYRREGLIAWQGMHHCGYQEYGVDFQGIDLGRDFSGDSTSADCQRSCTLKPGCKGFTWLEFSCYLKTHNGSDFERVTKTGCYSGYSCLRNETQYQWIWDERSKHVLPNSVKLQPSEPASMLCIQVLTPWTYEVDLFALQHEKRIGIFQCDSFAVYSNQLLRYPEGFTTRKLNSSQYCKFGGAYGSSLNADVFLALWRAVLSDAELPRVRWVIKVDPDTVFFPSRLRPLLLHYEKHHPKIFNEDGVYFVDRKNGPNIYFAGSLEVYSSNALLTLARVSLACFDSMQGWGDWMFGEDTWVEHCFHEKTWVEPNEWYLYQLLAPFKSCWGKYVAFHPFKDLNAQAGCYRSQIGNLFDTQDISTSTATFSVTQTTATTTRSPTGTTTMTIATTRAPTTVYRANISFLFASNTGAMSSGAEQGLTSTGMPNTIHTSNSLFWKTSINSTKLGGIQATTSASITRTSLKAEPSKAFGVDWIIVAVLGILAFIAVIYTFRFFTPPDVSLTSGNYDAQFSHPPTSASVRVVSL